MSKNEEQARACDVEAERLDRESKQMAANGFRYMASALKARSDEYKNRATAYRDSEKSQKKS